MGKVKKGEAFKGINMLEFPGGWATQSVEMVKSAEINTSPFSGNLRDLSMGEYSLVG